MKLDIGRRGSRTVAHFWALRAYLIDDNTLVSITIICPRKFCAAIGFEPCPVKLWRDSFVRSEAS
jgi:hypothetical protein